VVIKSKLPYDSEATLTEETKVEGKVADVIDLRTPTIKRFTRSSQASGEETGAPFTSPRTREFISKAEVRHHQAQIRMQNQERQANKMIDLHERTEVPIEIGDIVTIEVDRRDAAGPLQSKMPGVAVDVKKSGVVVGTVYGIICTNDVKANAKKKGKKVFSRLGRMQCYKSTLTCATRSDLLAVQEEIKKDPEAYKESAMPISIRSAMIKYHFPMGKNQPCGCRKGCGPRCGCRLKSKGCISGCGCRKCGGACGNPHNEME
jgi:hypothetical protein